MTGTIEAVDSRGAVVGLGHKGQFAIEVTEEVSSVAAEGTEKMAIDFGAFLRFGTWCLVLVWDLERVCDL